MANNHTFQNSLIITGSVTSSVGFSGDGSGLTNITATAEWDGTRNGDANITGSFTVSGSAARVDFISAEGGVSGSFSGSFHGDGSNLSNIAAGSNTQVQLNSSGNLGATSNLTYNSGLLIVSESIKVAKSGSGNLSIAQDINETTNTSAITSQGVTGFGGLKFISKNAGGTTAQLFSLKNSSTIFHSRLILTGSSNKVDFTRASAISGSIFSGSFVGDGSNLTGIAAEWDGSRNGDANITGSLVVSGSGISVSLLGPTTVDKNILISNKSQQADMSIGNSSLPDSTISRDSLTIGSFTTPNLLSGSKNIAIGSYAMNTAIKTECQTAIGYCALHDNIGYATNYDTATTTFSSNTAVGAQASQKLSTGRCTTSLGAKALYCGLGGSYSTALGHTALFKGQGTYNTAVGYDAGCLIGAGFCNTVVGSQAAKGGYHRESVAVGSKALCAVTSGNYNTAIGNFAGASITSGDCNIIIGYKAGPSAASAQTGKLYVDVQTTDSPLIFGDFITRQVTINNQVSASLFSGSFVGDGSGLTGVSGQGFPFIGEAQITGSLIVSQSTAAGTAVSIEKGHVILTQVSSSLNAHNDLQASLLGVPIGGLYRNGNFIQIRIR